MKIAVDLMSVSRFSRVAEHHRYRGLVFTEGELAQAGEPGPARHTERLAGRFCVKEAVCKLLGRGFGQGLRWRDIEVIADEWGAPAVTLNGGARGGRAARLGDIAVTITHQVDLVVAVAASGGRERHDQEHRHRGRAARLVPAQSGRNPTAVALRMARESSTYQQMHEHALALAGELVARRARGRAVLACWPAAASTPTPASWPPVTRAPPWCR